MGCFCQNDVQRFIRIESHRLRCETYARYRELAVAFVRLQRKSPFGICRDTRLSAFNLNCGKRNRRSVAFFHDTGNLIVARLSAIQLENFDFLTAHTVSKRRVRKQLLGGLNHCNIVKRDC